MDQLHLSEIPATPIDPSLDLTRRAAIGKAVRWAFFGTIAASLVEGVGGVDPKTGRCDCLFCQAERALTGASTPHASPPSRGRAS